VLATWKQLIDNGTLQSGDASLAATARPAVARLNDKELAALDGAGSVTVSGSRGSITLPVVAADLPDGVVWLPSNSSGRGLLAEVAACGESVRVKGVRS
ncbi:MAG: NADH-quinone oxidoreductase subunit G, partial [Nocardioides sp.]